MTSYKDNYPLIALDMDGTLLNSQRTISPRTMQALERISAQGVEVVLSTGRCRGELAPYLDILPEMNYYIMESGACVYDAKNKKTVYSAPLTEKEVAYIMEVIDDAEVTYQFFLDNESYLSIEPEELAYYHMDKNADIYNATAIFKKDLIEEYKKNPSPVEKVNLYFHDEKERERVWNVLEKSDFAIASSLASILEISSPKANKGIGLTALCNYLKLDIEKVIAVGDSDNDIDLLKTAGIPVAMGNALPELKAIATEITKDCDSDGVAVLIDKYYK